jgi:hypothetical protein
VVAAVRLFYVSSDGKLSGRSGVEMTLHDDLSLHRQCASLKEEKDADDY